MESPLAERREADNGTGGRHAAASDTSFVTQLWAHLEKPFSVKRAEVGNKGLASGLLE